ncbi:MAG: type II toxin-antitoxin system HipA family toxin [Gemmatimonadota bacterium]
MIQVWADGAPVGRLDRRAPVGTSFAADPDASAARAVSLTMPPRVASYEWPRGLLPIFEMHLPEGVLRERLRLRFAKATGTFDALDLLSIVGRTQLGRLRYAAPGEALDEAVPFQRVAEILAARRGGDLLTYLLETFAAYSGVSGVQPKVLIRDDSEVIDHEPLVHGSPRVLGATHLVKWWDAAEYPELGANENACLRAAARAGLAVPSVQLADSGAALVVARFDRHSDGSYGGFEDFCVLNGYNTNEKYRGSYETALAKRLRDYASPEELPTALRDLFRLFVLNCAVRNGDAHLKNFGLVYDDPTAVVRLAPVYDVVTTSVYLPRDQMALTLDGSTRWPTPKGIRAFGTERCELKPRDVESICEATADAMQGALADVAPYFAQCPTPDIGRRLTEAWQTGITETLGLGGRQVVVPDSLGGATPERGI